jgi:hypothetical protein
MTAAIRSALVKLADEYVKNLTPANNFFLESGTGARPVLTRSPYFASVSCSSFMTMHMNQVLDLTPGEWLHAFGAKFPTASRFFESTNRGILLKASTVQEIQAGDVGSIKYYPAKVGATGHVFLVVSEPRLLPEPFGTMQVYALDIVDSCRSSHGVGDTRRLKTGEDTGGVGRGTMRLLVKDSKVQGYMWSSSGASEVLLNGKGQDIVFGEVPKLWPLRSL